MAKIWVWHRVTIQNYLQGDLNFVLTNKKGKSTFTRNLLGQNRPVKWALNDNERDENQGSPNQAKLATSSPWFQWSHPISVKRWSFSHPVSLFKSVFFSPIIIYFFFNIHIKGAPMFLKCDPYRVWCLIFYSKLVNCILLRSLFIFVKGRGTCGSGERNVKIWIDFWKSPVSQEREKSSRPVFTMCGEPCRTIFLF